MKTTTKLAWGILALAAGLALAAAAAIAATDPGSAANERAYELRSIFHYGVFTAKPADKGTEVTLTASDPLVVKAIRAEFDGGRHPVRTALPGTTLSATLIDKGAVLTFRSDDPAQAELLKAQGVNAAYYTLRAEMRDLMWAGGTPGPGYGPGFGRGYRGMGRHWGGGPGPGFGPWDW